MLAITPFYIAPPPELSQVELPDLALQHFGGGPLTSQDYAQHATACRQFDRASRRQTGAHLISADFARFQQVSPAKAMAHRETFGEFESAAARMFAKDAGPVSFVINPKNHAKTLFASEITPNESKWELALYFIIRIFGDPTVHEDLRQDALTVLGRMKTDGAVNDSDEVHLRALIAIIDCKYSTGKRHYDGPEPFQTALGLAHVNGEMALRVLQKFALTADERKAVILRATAEDPTSGINYVMEQNAEFDAEFVVSVMQEAIRSLIYLRQHHLVNDFDVQSFLISFIRLAEYIPTLERAQLLTELFNNFPVATASALLNNYRHENPIGMWTWITHQDQGLPRVFGKFYLKTKTEAILPLLNQSVELMLETPQVQFSDTLVSAIDRAALSVAALDKWK